ncbi:LPS export ABC transporter permease LptF, partial [Pseudomonas sp. MWU12-2534b]
MLGAEKGHQDIRHDGSRYLILEDGYRYDGNPGEAYYRVRKYDTYGVLLDRPDVSVVVTDRDAMPNTDLRGKDHRPAPYQPQWSLSHTFVVFTVPLIELPLPRCHPCPGPYP